MILEFSATTKIDLGSKVKDKEFSEELYYRISSIKLLLPSLRERQGDVKALAEHFLNYQRAQDDAKIISESAYQVLETHSWSRNIEELKNLMEKVFIMAEGRFIDATLLKENLTENDAQVQIPEEEFLALPLSEIEKEHIIKTLDHLGGNKTKAAKTLGITVKTLYNKLHSYGMVQKR